MVFQLLKKLLNWFIMDENKKIVFMVHDPPLSIPFGIVEYQYLI